MSSLVKQSPVLPEINLGAHLTKKEQQYLNETEQKLSKVRGAKESAKKKIDKLKRVLNETPEGRELVRLIDKMKQLNKSENELAIKVTACYEQALIDVPGETLIDKLTHLSGE